jgi:hypothetical protein
MHLSMVVRPTQKALRHRGLKYKRIAPFLFSIGYHGPGRPEEAVRLVQRRTVARRQKWFQRCPPSTDIYTA